MESQTPNQDQSPISASALFRFGVFEADPRSGELRKNGAKVRLQEQPFQILLLLLERPGEVVTREELRQRLWSNDTFVDFDHGLNTAINKVRDALGDTASNPRFVETLARRGYRFVAPVQRVELQATGSQAANGDASAGPVVSLLQNSPGAPPSRSEAELRWEAESNGITPAQADAAKTVLDDELPRPHRGLIRFLFVLIQLMYLAFYVVALVRLEYIGDLVDRWRSGYGLPLTVLILVSASVGIAIRLYLLTGASFDYRKLGLKFRRLFPFVLVLDQLWALSPFLLLPETGIGAAFAACAALLYLPFSERTLIRMAYSYEQAE